MEMGESPSSVNRSASERVFAGVGVAIVTVGVATVAHFEPTETAFYPACPLYTLTGFACPGCGLTRGFHALFHGDVLTALDHNALLPVFAAFLGYLYLSMLFVAVRGRGLPVPRMSGPILLTMLGTMLVFGVVRNLPFYPFSVLFP